jgi:hypothetical protein
MFVWHCGPLPPRNQQTPGTADWRGFCAVGEV